LGAFLLELKGQSGAADWQVGTMPEYRTFSLWEKLWIAGSNLVEKVSLLLLPIGMQFCYGN
jgi:hypothetical protein